MDGYQKIYYANPEEKVVAAFRTKMLKKSQNPEDSLPEILKIVLQYPLVVNDRKIDVCEAHIYFEVEHLFEPSIYEDTSDENRKIFKVVAENKENYLLFSIEGDGAHAVVSKNRNSRFQKIK